MDTTKRTLYITFSGILVAIACFFVILAIIRKANPTFLQPKKSNPSQVDLSGLTPKFDSFKQFSSDQEFKDYMETGSNNGSIGFSRNTVMRSDMAFQGKAEMSLPVAGGGGVDRVSDTNVQVFGIDEPDIVKADGSILFYSQSARFDSRPVPMPLSRSTMQTQAEPFIGKIAPEKAIPPMQIQGAVSLINIFPPLQIAKLSDIDSSGELLLTNNRLIVFDEQNYDKRAIVGFDVSNPSTPVKKWSIPLKQNVERMTARLYKNKLYYISRKYMNEGSSPCPIPFLDIQGRSGMIPCTSIYRPSVQTNSDSVYSVFIINPEDGTVEKSMSFVASSAEATVYMSRNTLYIAYHYSGDLASVMSGFVMENSDMFPASIVNKITKLKDYDISQGSKINELTLILSRFTASFDEDKRLVFENNLQNRMKQFISKHSRDLEKTGIVSMDTDTLKVKSTGDVPGKVLNQFSLDDYKGNLRIATTIGQNSWFGQFGRLTNSYSDIYVLDGNLKTVGSVKDLGKTERIYSVRFIADKGYVVTFRQTDPLYVIDLSNASFPKVAGELKISGYSAYLHPLSETILLGIGKEGSEVKLSLFDVSNAQSPVEVDKFIMNEYWSEALNNHRAFMADDKYSVFFLPGSQGGYVFSHKNNKLEMLKAVADTQVKRAVYVNDYLYVVGENKIVVFDEKTWNNIKEFEL